MDSVKSVPLPQSVAGSAHSTSSQLPPTLSLPSAATVTPHITRAQKRKLDTEDGPSPKRLHKEPTPASTPSVSPESRKPSLYTPRDNREHNPHIEADDRCQEPPVVEDNQGDKTEDPPLGRPRPSPPAQLSKANLDQLQQEVVALEEMDHTIMPSDRGRKRASSRQTSSSDLASTRSKEPTFSHGFYRYSILDRANVYVLPEPPPVALQAQLDIIFKREMTDERRREISAMAKDKSRDFSQLLRGSHREDDLVELVHRALFDMHRDKTLAHPRKADWNPALKPTIQEQRFWNFDPWGQPDVEGNEGLDRPGKRQQADRPFPSPDTSQSTMPPPTAPRLSGNTVQPQAIPDGAVKTPRPDFTWGFHKSTVANALIKRGLPESRANRFLEALQRDQKLYSDPTQHFLQVRFPILVIEGKAYTTGKTLFEAENQAAVSGSSMLILRRQLESYHDHVVLDSDVKRDASPLAFSLCTQGPIMELWVHYIFADDDITEYHMNLVATCHGSLCNELERLLLQMDCLIDWYKHEFLEETADQLFAIASHVAR